ncbi:MAG: hypothetical protein DMG73_18015 [Acidobacteria bacterium]|nr:MAG: hypothetical protein DMG73_18015 [Acidobacteriota bacterium]
MIEFLGGFYLNRTGGLDHPNRSLKLLVRGQDDIAITRIPKKRDIGPIVAIARRVEIVSLIHPRS